MKKKETEGFESLDLEREIVVTVEHYLASKDIFQMICKVLFCRKMEYL